MNIRLPDIRKPGGQKKGAEEKYINQLQMLAEDMKEAQREIDFSMSARGWCYIMEQFGLEKGDFETGQLWINQCRLYGLLEPGFILEEEGHAVEGQNDKSQSVEAFVKDQYEMWQTAGDYFKDSWCRYDGISFWEAQDCYIQLLVEKSDLKSLFRGICGQYRIPVANLRGWGSMEQKAVMAENFQLAEEEGKTPILLACGDFDPPGLCISDVLKKQFEEYSTFTGWSPANLIVKRIGLSYNFIQNNNLTWVDNLLTGSGKDMSNPNHEFYKKNVYGVREYIAKYGVRKCEANAIVIVPELGRKMLQDAVDEFLGKDAYKSYLLSLETGQSRAKELIKDKLNDEYEEEE